MRRVTEREKLTPVAHKSQGSSLRWVNALQGSTTKPERDEEPPRGELQWVGGRRRGVVPVNMGSRPTFARYGRPMKSARKTSKGKMDLTRLPDGKPRWEAKTVAVEGNDIGG